MANTVNDPAGEDTASDVVLSAEQAQAIRDALEDYMRLPSAAGFPYREYRKLWNAADNALVPLRGGPMSQENR